MTAALALHKYLLIAWDQDVTSAPYEYTDMSHMLRDTGGIAVVTRRGRQNTTQKFQTGKGTFTLDNRWLTFESLNPNSPYSGLLTPMVPIQTGLEYPWLPGLVDDPGFLNGVGGWATTNCAVSPHPIPLVDIEPHWMDITCSVNDSDYSAMSAPILVDAAHIGSQVTASGRFKERRIGSNTIAFRVDIIFYNDAAGTIPITTISGNPVLLGSGNIFHERRAFVAPTNVPTLTQSMRFRYTILGHSRNGLAGDVTTVKCPVLQYAGVNIFKSSYSGYSDSWVSSVEELGDATCVLTCSDLYKAMGLFPMNSPLYGAYLATLGAEAWWRLNETLPAGLDQSVEATASVAFKEQISGNLDGHVSNGRSATFPYVGATLFGRGPLLGVAGASPLDTDFGFSVVGPSSNDYGALALGPMASMHTPNWTYVWWLRSTDGIVHPFDPVTTFNADPASIISGSSNFMGLAGAAAKNWSLTVWLDQATGKLTSDLFGHNLAGTACGTSAFNSVGDMIATPQTAWVADSSWHMFAITYVASTNAQTIYCDGVVDHVVPPTDAFGTPQGGLDLTGFPQSNSQTPWIIGEQANPTTPVSTLWKFEVDEFMRFGTALSGAQLSAMYVQAKIQYPQEPAGARADRVAGLVNVPVSLRNIDTTKGVEVAAVTQPFSKANPAQYLELLEDTDQAMCFISVDGLLSFITHRDLIDAGTRYGTASYIFGNGGGSEIPYAEAPTTNGDDIFYTQIATSRAGGVTKYADGNTTKFFTRQLPLSNLLLTTDDAAQDLASFLLAIYSKIGTRINSLVVRADVSEAALSAVANIEIGDLVTIRIRPQSIYRSTGGTFGSGTFGGGTFGLPMGMAGYFELSAQIQGINQDGNRGPHTTTYSVSTIYAQHWMQFGDNFNTYDMAL